MQKLSA